MEPLSNRANTWPSELLRVYPERQAPLYNSEDIVKLNNLNSAEIQLVNSSRTKLEKTFQDQIETYKFQIQQSHGQLETRLAAYRKELAEIDSKLNMYNGHPNLVPNFGHNDHPLRLQYTRTSVSNSIQSEMTRVNTEINNSVAEIT